VKCASNLRQIGQAAILYSQDNLRTGGPFGPNFDALANTQQISKNVFECPSASGSGTGGLTGSPCSYVWMGANLSPRSNPLCVMAYEPLSNHGGEGINVLFADGHVEFVNKNTAAIMIRNLEAGQNPPLGSSGR
jgi:prepilin-type processing-associated H-X9-DG protein